MGDHAASDDLRKTRQKNCNSCVQAKRRCDRRTPICSRCTEKQTPCIYSKNKVPTQPEQEDFDLSYLLMGRQAIGSPACSPFAPGWSPDVDYLGTTPMDFQLGVATAATRSMHDHAMEATIDDAVPIDPFINLMEDSITTIHDQCLVPIEQVSDTEPTRTSADEAIWEAYNKMADFCVSPSNFRP